MENILIVFGLSFLTALTGALQPGPLLTYTIIKTLAAPRRGWLTGARIIAGHALIELAIVVAILQGLASILTNMTTVRIIGISGTLFLLFLAFLVFRDIFVKNVDLPNNNTESFTRKKGVFKNPILGGIFISMSNPFWWIWWATLGFFFMQKYDVSLGNIPLLISFYLGHELGDLSWYSLVSIMTHTGRRWLNQRRYQVILGGTAVILVGFAGFIFFSSFQYQG
jgi:threonine/homoserine/homoserine lactone efflux protein